MTVATLPSPAALRCHKHREERAAWRCDSCGRTFCDPCLKEKVAGRRHADSCPVCQGFCRGLIPANDAAPRSCLEAIQDAFAYPLRGHGAVVLVLGAILLGFLSLLARSWSWRMGLFFGVFGAGYLSAFMFRIAETSANGSRQLPEWPEFTDIWESAALPFFQMAVPWICCLAPAGLPFLIFGWSPEGLFGACAIAFVTSFFVPMAILSIALNNSVAGMHPSSVFPAIWAVKAPYLGTWLVWSLLGGASIAFEHFVASGIPFLGSAINGLLSLYLITVEMRLLGLLYFSHSGRMKLV